jgi:hypothetical protein
VLSEFCLLKALTVRKWGIDPSVFAAAKSCMSQKLETLEDFRSVGEFMESFPLAIATSDFDLVRAQFEISCVRFAGGWEDNPDMLRSIAEEIAAVGTNLGADVEMVVKTLHDRALDLEIEQPYEESDSDDSDYGWSEEIRVTQAVDSMFDALL